jgi:hypothetical protein
MESSFQTTGFRSSGPGPMRYRSRGAAGDRAPGSKDCNGPAIRGELHMSKAWFITGASSSIGPGLARFAAHLLGEAAYPHVLDHARLQRAYGPVGRMGGHGVSSLKPKVAGPSMLGIGCLDRHALPLTIPRKRTGRDAHLSRQSGLVLGSNPADRLPLSE